MLLVYKELSYKFVYKCIINNSDQIGINTYWAINAKCFYDNCNKNELHINNTHIFVAFQYKSLELQFYKTQTRGATC